ncbi:MAG: sigma-70 family RNA polymerase sigma factor [Cyclobacteriaceae bacterium]
MAANPHITTPQTGKMSDAEVWQKLKGDDKTALEYIYNQNIEVLYRYGHKFSNDRGLIEDCIQEVFLTLWERRFVIGDTDAIKPYILTALRRRMIRATSKNHIRIDRNFEIEEYDFHMEYNPEEKLIMTQDDEGKIKRLSDELNKLTIKQQEVVYLRYHCELNYEEIAGIMAISYQSARNLMFKTLKLLRKQFLQLLLIFGLLAQDSLDFNWD